MGEENDIYVKYDAICSCTFINIYGLTKEESIISFINYNDKNKEHKFVLAVALSCWGVLGEKPIAIDAGLFTRVKISKQYKALPKIRKTKIKKGHKYVDVVDLLKLMRDYATELCGETFTFGDIYDAYYMEGENI